MAPNSFFEEIHSTYGAAVHAAIKKITRLQDKLTRLNNRRKFLTKCRTYGVFPQHIQVHIPCIQQIYDQHPNFSKRADNISKRLRRSILSLEIRITHASIKENENTLRTNTDILKESLPEPVYARYEMFERRKQQRLDQKLKTRNINKLSRLRNRVSFGQQVHDEENKNSTIVNLTNTQIPDRCSELLCLGPKFALNPPSNHKQTYINLIADAEHVLTNAYRDDEQTRNEKRQRTNNILTNFANKFPSMDQHEAFLRKEYFHTQRWLKQNKDILVTLADKGNKTVFINKQEYDEKINELLDDTNVYQSINRDPSKSMMNQHNRLIKRIMEEGGLEQGVGKSLCCRNGVLGRIYGQVKLHKEGKPLRPIISTIGTTTYKTAKYITGVLSSIIGNGPLNMKDSFQLATILKNMTLPPDHIMVSFDVVSMFTNIPIEFALDIIKDRFEELSPSTTLNKNQFIEIIKFICDNCYFTYDDKIFKQKRGLPMGSSLSPALAELVMDKLLNTALERMDNIWYITRYVDDIFLIVPTHDVHRILMRFNNLHPDIRFTLEMESRGRLNFLELTVCRQDDGRLNVSWYRKPTASLRYLNFYSNHTITQKKNIVLMLDKRLQAFSDATTFNTQRNEVRRILMSNDYPSYFIERYLGRRMQSPDGEDLVVRDDTVSVLNPTPDSLAPPKKYYKIPYVRGLSQRIKKILTTDNIEVVFYHTHTIGQLYSNTKPPIPLQRQSNLVYSIPCDCGAFYVGQTMQHLGERIQQHRASIGRLLKGNLTQQTGITIHMATYPTHTLQFDRTRVIDRESNYHKRLIKEAIHITKTRQRLNLQSDISDSVINIVYASVVGRLC